MQEPDEQTPGAAPEEADASAEHAPTPWRDRPGVWPGVLVLAVVGILTVVALIAGTIAFLVTSRPGERSDLADPAPSPSLLTPTDEPDATPGGDPTTPGVPDPSPTDLPTTPPDLTGGETWLPDIDVRTAALRRDGVDLRDVHLVARGARLGSDGTIRAQEFEMEATVPFATVEAQVGGGIRLGPTEDGLVRATLPLTVFGRTLDLGVDAEVQAEGDRIAFRPVRTPGAPTDGGALGGVFDRVGAIRQEVPDLPDGASVDHVEVLDEGFRVRASGQDVSLKP
ncbi:MAG: LmeA family phospholipid-binding protein [Mobilicoccus sp.]|nr:LmeA family phospholipid-binding protein [Mobilicoccus sp.]